MDAAQAVTPKTLRQPKLPREKVEAMISPKAQLLADESLSQWWRDLAHSKDFDRGLALAIAQFSMSNPSSEALRGVNGFITVLSTLADKDVEREEMLMPRLTPPELLTQTLNPNA